MHSAPGGLYPLVSLDPRFDFVFFLEKPVRRKAGNQRVATSRFARFDAYRDHYVVLCQPEHFRHSEFTIIKRPN